MAKKKGIRKGKVGVVRFLGIKKKQTAVILLIIIVNINSFFTKERYLESILD
jgi:hypothetical protein